jgi:hypothetical protein
MDSYDDQGEVLEPARSMPAIPTADSRPQNLIFASPECGQVFGALCAMQGAMEAPKRTKEAKVKGRTKSGSEYDYTYKYAPLEEIITAVKTPMAQADLAYRQFLASRNGQWIMRTVVAHKSGEWFGADYPIFWDEARGMQGFASGVTYARRYGLMLALGIAAEDDDDANMADGQPATTTATRGPRQAAAKAAPADLSPAPAASLSDVVGTKARSQAEYKIIWGQIAEAIELPVLEQIEASQDWKDLAALTHEADPTIADKVMRRLKDHLESRRDLLLGEAGNARYVNA